MWVLDDLLGIRLVGNGVGVIDGIVVLRREALMQIMHYAVAHVLNSTTNGTKAKPPTSPSGFRLLPVSPPSPNPTADHRNSKLAARSEDEEACAPTSTFPASKRGSAHAKKDASDRRSTLPILLFLLSKQVPGIPPEQKPCHP